MKSGSLFDDHETALVSVPLARVVGVIAGLGGAAVALFAIALAPWQLGAVARLALAGVGLVNLLVAARITSVRLRFEGGRFEVHRPWKTWRGSAEQFLGYRPGLFSDHVYLLRRDDLTWIELPAVVPRESLDSDRHRWLHTYLPGVGDEGVRALRRRAELPSATARALIERARPALPQESFCGSPADLELAQAARSVAKSRYDGARESLEALLPRLPAPSVSLPFVFDALRSIGTPATAAAIARVLPRFGRERTHAVRALAALATQAERPLLESLLNDEARFVVREARDALRRLERETPPASDSDREHEALRQ